MTRTERRQARKLRQETVRALYRQEQELEREMAISEAQPRSYMDERCVQSRGSASRAFRRRAGYLMAGASVLCAAG